MKQEVQHRTGQGYSTFRDYSSKIYKNPTISIETKLMVLQATAMAAMHYGAGTWTGLTQRDHQTWTTAHMTLYRRLFSTMHHHLDVRHLTDSYILAQLGAPPPPITLRLLRLRWYGSCLLLDLPAFWVNLAYERHWLQDVEQDMQWVYQQIKGFTCMPDPSLQIDAWHLFARMHPGKWKKLLKRASLHCVWQQRVQYHVAEYHGRALDLLAVNGAQLPDRQTRQVERAHHCFICRKDFSTLAGWAVHAFKKHNRVNKWRRLQAGHTCLACAKTFHSAARLSRHFRSVRSCSDTLAAKGFWVPLEPSLGSTTVAQQEKTLLLSTWDYTDCDAIPEQAGWTATEQAWSFLNLCRNIDWTSHEAENQCLQHLQHHAVCESELREVQQLLQTEVTTETDVERLRQTLDVLIAAARPETAVVEHGLNLLQCVNALQTTETPVWPAPQLLRAKFRYVLHLFSGVRRTGDLHSIIQELPVPDGHVFYPASIDIVLCRDKGDLTSRKAQDFWLEASQSGILFGAIGGPPCATWSVSRWRYILELVGPRPIRDGMDPLQDIWAINPTRIRDLQQLDVAKQLLLFMVLLIISQASRHRCCIVEHPACPLVGEDGIQPSSISGCYQLWCTCGDAHMCIK